MSKSGTKKIKDIDKETLKEIKECFDLFDKDKNGTITASELASLVRSLGQNPTTKEIEKMIKELDTNGNKKVEFGEFTAWMLETYKDIDPKKQMLNSFLVFDRNRDGFIGLNELRNVLKHLGQEKLTDKEVKDMLAAVDADKDGRVNYQEFVAMMNTPVKNVLPSKKK